jgi:hypothetical protein
LGKFRINNFANQKGAVMLQRKRRNSCKPSLTTYTHKDAQLDFRDYTKARKMSARDVQTLIGEMELGIVIRLTSVLSSAQMDKVTSYAVLAGKSPEQITREALAEHIETTIETDLDLLQERLCSA